MFKQSMFFLHMQEPFEIGSEMGHAAGGTNKKVILASTTRVNAIK